MPDDRGTVGPADGADGDDPLVRRAREIFFSVRAMDLESREAAAARLCGDDEALATMVRLLLRGDMAAWPVEALAENIRAAQQPSATGADEHAKGELWSHESSRIGRYRLLERIGEGGFGVVYLAEQEEPVKRRVALKIIKLGMDTKQVVARFEAERQALALMDHTSIARVFDAGATASGRPYFVMELVRGLPITEYCDQHMFSIPQRLALMGQICHAMHHAHQRGVIHRDIKPSNVLVSTVDTRPVPKIIDFGIAKATSARLTERTVFTEFRQMIGTPEYMSPEQAGVSDEDVDIRTDVYSAGVLLYELLVGSTPFDSKRLRSAAYGEMQRIIREEDPPKPSTRLTGLGDTVDAVAQRRATPPARLASAVKGELDWIVMKAIDKNRSRRYGTANEMALDIERFLSGQAIHAAPPSPLYLARKFARRHRVAVTAGALIGLSIVAGLIGTTVGLTHAVDANRNLSAALTRVKQEESKAIRAADRLEAVHGFFIDRVLGASDPDLSGGEDLRLRQVLDGAVAELPQQPDAEVEGVLRHEIGAVYLSLGMWKDAMVQLERAASIRERSLETTVAERADTLLLLARAAQSLNDPARAESLARTARAFRESVHGGDSDAVAEVDYYLAAAIYRLGRVSDAGMVNEASLKTMSARHARGSEPGLMARTMVMYASEFLSKQGRHEEAASMLRDAVGILRRAGQPQSQLAWALSALSRAAAELENFDESDRCIEESIAIRRRLLPSGHTSIAQSLVTLGVTRMRQRRPAEGEAPVREGIALYTAALGADHEFVAKSTVALGAILASQEKWQEAADAYAHAAAIYAARFPGDDARTANARSQWGGCLIELNQYIEAEKLLLDAWGMLERTKSDPAAQRATARRLVGLYQAWKRDDDAQQWSIKADAIKPP